MEGKSSPQDRRPTSRETQQTSSHAVHEFRIYQRGVALRMRIERGSAARDSGDDEALAEAGYGHGV